MIFGLVCVSHVTLKLAETSVLKSRTSVPYGAIFSNNSYAHDLQALVAEWLTHSAAMCSKA